jgi:AhpD family alkylhydroperoxidase
MTTAGEAPQPRIAPGRREDVGTVNWLVCLVLGRAAGTPPPNLFTTLGRRRGLFRGWLHFAGRLMPGGRLPRRETELVILRVAHRHACTYEWDHHVRLGRRAGLSAQEIELLRADLQADRWVAREAAILAAVDELHEAGDLTDAAWDRLRAHLDDAACIELVLLVGHYEMLATTIATLRIAPDPHRPERPDGR